MKIEIVKSSIYKTDNQYYDITIGGIQLKKMERSEIRYLIGVLDNKISN